ncbi:unnamed protein product [Camellia sinensis]
MENFLNQKSVREALGVGDIELVSCSSTVYQAMILDWIRNLEVGIPPLLEDGIQLLVYDFLNGTVLGLPEKFISDFPPPSQHENQE